MAAMGVEERQEEDTMVGTEADTKEDTMAEETTMADGTDTMAKGREKRKGTGKEKEKGREEACSTCAGATTKAAPIGNKDSARQEMPGASIHNRSGRTLHGKKEVSEE